MIKLSCLLCFLFALFSFGFNASLNANEQGFSADISLSSNALFLNENLTLSAKLTFPENYHPNIDEMTSRLTAYNGFYPPPFHLIKSNVNKPEKIGSSLKLEINYILSPQLPGKHRITLQVIKFESKTKGENPVFITTDIFDVEFHPPKNLFNVEDLISPPLTFSKQFPITIDLSNKREFQESPALISQEKVDIEKSLLAKTPPFVMLISAVVVLIAIAIIRS